MRTETGTDEATFDLLRLCRYATEQSPLPMIATEGPTHIVCYANPAFCRLAGKEREELIGRPISEAVPEGDENGCRALLDRVYRLGEAETLSDQQHAPFYSPGVYWSYTAWAIRDEQERPAGVMVQVMDTTQALLTRLLMRAISQALTISGVRHLEFTETAEAKAEQLQQAMRETDHRVKNNLQILGAMLDMYVMEHHDTVPVNDLIALRMHIKTLASIHDLLVHNVQHDPAASLMSVQAMLRKLMPMLQQVMGTQHTEWSAEEVQLPIKQVMSLALLINELVGNAFKHGGQKVELRLTTSDNRVTLEVCDDGPGFAQGFDPSAAANYGLEFVESVSRLDLRGQTTYSNRREGGACVTVIFPTPG